MQLILNKMSDDKSIAIVTPSWKDKIAKILEFISLG